VLDTASSLIADAAWPLVTPGDAGALVLSTLLHDCAMHLSEDGFIALVTGRYAPATAEKPWPELWRQFLGEASRFDGRKLTALFGRPDPAPRPRLDGSAMTRTDRLLIGEFLRRHHARLAQEIARDGVPGPGKERLRFRSVLPWLASLSGLIARSHGMPIRTAAEQLPKYQRRIHHDVHAPFVMAVLRIADYLQVHSERAPAALLLVRGLGSPVSRGEWALHEIIETIHALDDDPEALFIAARPRSAAEFIRARTLFESIQRELDETWALLGEVYGRVPVLNSLGLTLRRIKSNLDDVEAFSRTVSFVPVAASFTSAGGELLKLLVGPLYNDDPNIAIRELMQNAVDAVVELRDYLSVGGRRPDRGVDPDVIIDLRTSEDGGGSLTVEDRGIGMTADTIVNYFLRAGASFRGSDYWREHHTADGQPRISRSGRFGIGALAAFLAGDRIHVTTRHVSSPTGIAFSAGIDDRLIDLEQISRDVGTTVRVELRPEAEKRFHESPHSNWDWYCLSDPVVKRLHNGDALSQRVRWPPVHAQSGPSWKRVAVPGYADIQYSIGSGEPMIVCNGIAISRLSPTLELGIRRPHISVFDGEVSLPLDLRRSQTVEPLPFAAELLESLLRDIITAAVSEAPEDPRPLLRGWRFEHHALYTPQDPHGGWLFWTPRGWALAQASSFADLSVDRVVVCNGFPNGAQFLVPEAHGVVGLKPLNNARSIVAGLITPNPPWWQGAAGLRLLVSQSLSLPRQNWQSVAADLEARQVGEWWLLSWGKSFKRYLDLESIAKRVVPDADNRCIGEVLLPYDMVPGRELPFAKIWRQLLPGGVIPFSRSERRRLSR